MAKPRQKKKRRTRRGPTPKAHPFVKWLRATGIPAELFGWAGLMLTTFFWPAVVFIYCGFGLLALDLWREPDLRVKPFWRFGGVALIFAFALAFTFTVVFVSAPLDADVYALTTDYPKGANVAGILWMPKMTELRVNINNPTDKDYENLDFEVTNDLTTADAVQISQIPNVFISAEEKDNGYKLPASYYPHKAWSKIFRIRCDKPPRNSTLQLLLVVLPFPELGKPVQIIEDGDGQIFHLAEPENKRQPQWVEARGQYRSGLRVREFATRIEPVPVKNPLQVSP